MGGCSSSEPPAVGSTGRLQRAASHSLRLFLQDPPCSVDLPEDSDGATLVRALAAELGLTEPESVELIVRFSGERVDCSATRLTRLGICDEATLSVDNLPELREAARQRVEAEEEAQLRLEAGQVLMDELVGEWETEQGSDYFTGRGGKLKIKAFRHPASEGPASLERPYSGHGYGSLRDGLARVHDALQRQVNLKRNTRDANDHIFTLAEDGNSMTGHCLQHDGRWVLTRALTEQQKQARQAQERARFEQKQAQERQAALDQMAAIIDQGPTLVGSSSWPPNNNDEHTLGFHMHADIDRMRREMEADGWHDRMRAEMEADPFFSRQNQEQRMQQLRAQGDRMQAESRARFDADPFFN